MHGQSLGKHSLLWVLFASDQYYAGNTITGQMNIILPLTTAQKEIDIIIQLLSKTKQLLSVKMLSFRRLLGASHRCFYHILAMAKTEMLSSENECLGSTDLDALMIC